jgi:starch synthase (maltosyl-transferring)
MNDLKRLLKICAEKGQSFSKHYYIPEKWNSFGFADYKKDSDRSGEISVNPYDFFCAAVKALKNDNCSQNGIIYGILPRSFTAWPHYDKQNICSGTFFKAIMLLPLLKSFGVGCIYLLPVFQYSDSYKKGSLGSPYSIKDIYNLDRGLHEPLLGDYSAELMNAEFRAFVEACHMTGIKVIVDFVFRTVARDSVLISQHPDWFYWIKEEFEAEFKPPTVGGCRKRLHLNEATARRLYNAPECADYVSQFTLPPNEIDAAKWERITSCGKDNIGRLIRQEFGITTVPGFSDVINDSQPAWTDVTYLKFYFDSPMAQKYFPDKPPFIMQDSASLDKFPGKQKNTALWDYITGILPYYKKNFDIDGARIDMAHALPAELNSLIIKKIREIDGSFILWSEELDTAKSVQAKESGFDFISGYTYYDYKNVLRPSFNKRIANSFLNSAVPVTASLETPDTPRAAFIHKNPDLLKLLVVINNFMPNSIPMVNSGQILSEIQPMNLGLDNDESGRFVLPRNDSMYSRLAFFDTYCLHWKEFNEPLFKVFRDTAQIRRENYRLLNRQNFIEQTELYQNKKLTALCYFDRAKGKGLFIAANRSETSRARLCGNHLPIKGKTTMTKIYDNFEKCEEAVTNINMYLAPCEAVIIKFFGGRPI